MMTGPITARSSFFAARATWDEVIYGRSLATADAARVGLAAASALDLMPSRTTCSMSCSTRST